MNRRDQIDKDPPLKNPMYQKFNESVSAYRVKLYEPLKTSWISHFTCDASLRNFWELQICDTCYCLYPFMSQQYSDWVNVGPTNEQAVI